MADLKQAVEEIAKLPLYVVNSHRHYDHTVDNSAFPGPYYMHKADLEVYHRHNSPESRRMGLEVQKLQRILFFLHGMLDKCSSLFASGRLSIPRSPESP